MKRIDLGTLETDTSFRIKMEAYLYIDAGKMMQFGKGDPKKLRDYMDKRIRIIEELLKVSRPFKIIEGKETLLEVGE
jgi:hypothetical protein